jgi:hypothetical protein
MKRARKAVLVSAPNDGGTSSVATDVLVDLTTVRRIALDAQLDPRTVKRAIEQGMDSLQSEYAKVRLRETLKRMKRQDLIK